MLRFSDKGVVYLVDGVHCGISSRGGFVEGKSETMRRGTKIVWILSIVVGLTLVTAFATFPSSLRRWMLRFGIAICCWKPRARIPISLYTNY